MDHAVISADGEFRRTDRVLGLDCVTADLNDYLIADPELCVLSAIGVYNIIVIQTVVAGKSVTIIHEAGIYIIYNIRHLAHIDIAEDCTAL